MRYLLTALLALSILGCVQEPQYDGGFFRPDYTPNVPPSPAPSPAPASEVTIVLVTEPWCAACKDQKKILDAMHQKGSIGAVKVTHSKDQQYPASVLPTMYICTDRGCKKLEGLRTESEILGAVK